MEYVYIPISKTIFDLYDLKIPYYWCILNIVRFGRTKTSLKGDAMNLNEIVAPTMQELFIAELQRQILSGELKIGERLPTEREMAEKTKISKTVINSALSQLSRLGFVKIVPRKGMFVGDYIKNGNIDTLTSIMNFNSGKLDRKTFNSLVAFRSHNEKECAYLAAKNRSLEDIETLKRLYKEMLETNDVEIVTNLKVAFHNTIYYASGNTIHSLVFNSFRKLIYDFYNQLFRKEGCDKATIGLDELIDAIEKQEAHKAKNIMEELIDIRLTEIVNLFTYPELD